MKRKVKKYAGEDESLVSYKDVDYAYDPISKIVGEAEIKSARSSDERQAAANRGEPEKSARYQAEPASNVEKKPIVAAKKSTPIISVKEMKAAGYDNLRDYLNAKKGLKRRGAAKDENEDEAVASARSIAQGDKWREEQKAKKLAASQSEAKSNTQKLTSEEKTKKLLDEATEQAKDPRAYQGLAPTGAALKLLQGAAKNLAAKNAKPVMEKVEPYLSKMWRGERDITPGAAQIARDVPRLASEKLKLGMKKGGAVKSSSKQSSASSRGDGIAQRGKTRGKMY
jgi:hypothetical protein